MPQKKTAAKAHRKSLRAYAQHATVRKQLKDLRKKVDRALAGKRHDDALGFYRQFQKLVDKASKRGGFLKKNAAARYKSNMLRTIKRLTARS